MVIGTLTQALRVRALPTGVSMFITDVRFTIPSGSWWPGLLGISQTLSIYKNNLETGRKQLPLEIDRNYRDGHLGEAYLSSQSVWDSGNGPDISIDIQFQGSVDTGGKKTWYDKKGNIVVGSSEWSKVERPDWMRLKYCLDGGSWRELSTSVPGGGQPRGLDFVVGFNPQTKQLGLNATTDDAALNDLKSNAASGNFQDRSGAGGWSTSVL